VQGCRHQQCLYCRRRRRRRRRCPRPLFGDTARRPPTCCRWGHRPNSLCGAAKRACAVVVIQDGWTRWKSRERGLHLIKKEMPSSCALRISSTCVLCCLRRRMEQRQQRRRQRKAEEVRNRQRRARRRRGLTRRRRRDHAGCCCLRLGAVPGDDRAPSLVIGNWTRRCIVVGSTRVQFVSLWFSAPKSVIHFDSTQPQRRRSLT
jgi:hypothetical protein